MTGTTSTSAAEPKPPTNGEGHVKIASSKNKAGTKSQQSIAGGWGQGSRSAEITANENEADEESQQAVANAEVMPMRPMEERREGSAMDQSE